MAMKMAAKSKAAPKHKETQKTRIKQEKTSPRRTQKAKKETMQALLEVVEGLVRNRAHRLGQGIQQRT